MAHTINIRFILHTVGGVVVEGFPDWCLPVCSSSCYGVYKLNAILQAEPLISLQWPEMRYVHMYDNNNFFVLQIY